MVRQSQPADLPALRLIYLESRRATYPWQDATTMKLEDFDAATRDEPVLVAELEGEPIGFVSWWPPDNFVHNLFVAPGAVRRGVGTMLLEACLARIGRPARLKCQSRNIGALAYYAAQGWREVGRGESEEGEYLLLQFDGEVGGHPAEPARIIQ